MPSTTSAANPYNIEIYQDQYSFYVAVNIDFDGEGCYEPTQLLMRAAEKAGIHATEDSEFSCAYFYFGSKADARFFIEEILTPFIQRRRVEQKFAIEMTEAQRQILLDMIREHRTSLTPEQKTVFEIVQGA